MAKQALVSKLINKIRASSLDGYLTDIIAKLQGLQNGHKDEWLDITLGGEYEWEDGETKFFLYVWGARLETEQEAEAREREEERRAKLNEERERMEYERLRKKFEK